ncbi:uncharacterized protein Bfra_004084 [Botrytis fragariae]|uniref:Uncharacterized protein n=1 Tax=Botrytis fragariae TaxID=1964551 RepID=A0A8H6AUZ7_9HELO|nr:uncharacterized protein Bfra_004084 [Botrytis fragariae]KAF5874077.1 hypothetical protein Bfra_004084 [Botrytis fragariae]
MKAVRVQDVYYAHILNIKYTWAIPRGIESWEIHRLKSRFDPEKEVMAVFSVKLEGSRKAARGSQHQSLGPTGITSDVRQAHELNG